MGDQMERRNCCNSHVHDGDCDLLENDSDSYYPCVGLSVLAGCFAASHIVWARYFYCNLAPVGTAAHPRYSGMRTQSVGTCSAAAAEASNGHRDMSRMVGVGRAEEEAYRVVEEVEEYCGARAVDGRN